MSSRPSLWREAGGVKGLAHASPGSRLKALLALPLSVGVLAVGATAAADLADAAPPPGRAYEIVSPVDDIAGSYSGVSVDRYPMPGIASDDGDIVVFGSPIPLGDSWSGANNSLNFGRRTLNGWVAHAATQSLDYGETPLEVIKSDAAVARLTPDGKYLIFGSNSLGAQPIAPGGSFSGIFRASAVPGQAPDWLSKPAPGVSIADGINPSSVNASRDGSVVVFSSTQPLLPDAPAPGTSAVYALRDGELELVSLMPDGSIPTAPSYLANETSAGEGGINPPAVTARNQVSADGRFVYFKSGGNYLSGPLYVRDLEEKVTHQLAGGAPGHPSEAQRIKDGWGAPGEWIDVDQLSAPPPNLVFASSDGKLAYFKPNQGPAAQGYLAQANAETGAVTVLTEVKGPTVGLSPDGKRMLYLEPPLPGEAVGDYTLKYWDAATPNTSIEVAEIPSGSNPTYGVVRVYRSSEDGLSWVFSARSSLDPERENVNPVTHQLYLWTVGDPAPTCISCEPVDGIARSSGVNLTVQESIATEIITDPTTPLAAGSTNFGQHKRKIGQPGHSISADRRWLLFDSPDRLVEEDINNVRDVYLWDRDAAPGGKLFLLTSGRGTVPSYAVDLDPTGKNAFFTTRDGLVPADKNGHYDVYTARIGGGFPGSPKSCAGDSCRPPVPGGPEEPSVASAGAAGNGNVVETPVASKPALRVSQKKGRLGAATQLRVWVPGAGAVRVSGIRVRGQQLRTNRGGTVTLRVALKPRFRAALRKRSRLRAMVRVRYRAGDGRTSSRQLKIAFEAPKAKRASAGRGR